VQPGGTQFELLQLFSASSPEEHCGSATGVTSEEPSGCEDKSDRPSNSTANSFLFMPKPLLKGM
jgi:hypothetical protein